MRFCLVGFGNTVVDFAVFFVLTALRTAHIPAQLLSYSAGLCNSFILNRTWTFKAAGSFFLPQLGRFIVLNGLSLLISSGLLYLFCDIKHLELWLSKVLATAASMVINYLGSRIWVFAVSPSIRSEVS